MKKLELNPLVLGLGGLMVALVAFIAGNATPTIANPFVAPTRELNFSQLNELYGLMQRNFDGKIDDKAALEGARKGLVESGGDPYTTYLSADEAKKLNDELNGKLSGIGAELGIKNNILTIVAPIDDTPAMRAGLRPGDLIARINDEDTTGMSVDEAVSKIRGESGTKVTLKLVRNGRQDAFDVTITRAEITVPSVKWSLKNGNVAYIQVTRFGPDTAALLDKAAAELTGKGARSVILDLRNNGGGYLDAGVSVASQFLRAGQVVVQERTGDKIRDKLEAARGGRLIGLPAVVLINGGSASASEIVAGALADHSAAQLVGEKSFGKGSVQEIKSLPGGAELKITIAHWFTPSGRGIDKEGIKPNIEVKLTTEDYNASRDPQLDRALQLLK